MTGENKAKKEMDPIFKVCLVIFVVAAIIAIGTNVYDDFIKNDAQTASAGNTVEVTYTGAYYDYVGGEFALVFDTNDSVIGNDDKVAKSKEYTKKSTYDLLSFQIGKGTMLEKFEQACIGHKVGDKFTVKIDALSGYVAANSVYTFDVDAVKLSLTQNMTKSEFTSLYSNAKLVEGAYTSMFLATYGGPAIAFLDTSGNVKVKLLPEVGETYTAVKDSSMLGKTWSDDLEIDGQIKFTVKSVDENEMTGSVVIEDYKTVSGSEIQAIPFMNGQYKGYVTEYDGKTMVVKYGGEKVNADLYFTIELKSIA